MFCVLQPYDLALLTELRLPEFYIQMAKGSIALREKTVETIGEEQELEDYKRNMEWLQDSKTRFVHWYERNIKTDTPATVKKVCKTRLDSKTRFVHWYERNIKTDTGHCEKGM